MTDLNGPADGETFDPQRDESRLNTQRHRTFLALSDHRWHTSVELANLVGDNWSSVNARLRDLRKPRFGGYTIERRCVHQGLWEYRMVEEVKPTSSLDPKLLTWMRRYREEHPRD